MNNEKIVQNRVAPHIKSNLSTKMVMVHLVLALMPAFVVGISFYKVKAIEVVLSCVAFCVLFEIMWDIFANRRGSLNNLASISSGFVLGLCLPVNTPTWLCMLASFICIVWFKKIFHLLKGKFINGIASTVVIITLLFKQIVPTLFSVELAKGTLETLLIGAKQGAIGQVCVVALIFAVIYLSVVGIIDIKISGLSTIVCLSSLFVFNALSLRLAMRHLFTGNMFFVVAFLGSDFTCTPQTKTGKIGYCFVLGFLAALFRMFSSYSEGAMLGALLASMLSNRLDRMVFFFKYGLKNKAKQPKNIF